MIDRFVSFCLERRIAVFILAAMLAAYGVYAWETLSVEAYPELGDVAAQVTTQIPGLAAEEVEELITELAEDYTIAIVTHNMQQAARVSDKTAFMYLGELIEFDDTNKIFTSPSDRRTQDYITGRFG